jgi:hypothetical protein
MLKQLFNNNIVRIIIIIVLIFIVQHFYVNFNDNPMHQSKEFVSALFYKPTLDYIDKFSTEEFQVELEESDILSVYKKDQTKNRFLVSNGIDKMSITYLHDYMAICALGINRDSFYGENYIVSLKVVRSKSDSWLANLMPFLVDDTRTWKIDDYFTGDDLNDKEYNTDNLDKEIDLLLDNNNYKKIPEIYDKLSIYLIRKEYIKLKKLYNKKINFFENTK